MATVAQTILTQLGGTRFMAMTGARDFVGSPDALLFSLPRFAGCKVRKVRVKLGGDDLYSVTFYRQSSVGPIPLAEINGIYADSLRAVFTEHTGLETHL